MTTFNFYSLFEKYFHSNKDLQNNSSDVKIWGNCASKVFLLVYSRYLHTHTYLGVQLMKECETSELLSKAIHLCFAYIHSESGVTASEIFGQKGPEMWTKEKPLKSIWSKCQRRQRRKWTMELCTPARLYIVSLCSAQNKIGDFPSARITAAPGPVTRPRWIEVRLISTSFMIRMFFA